MQITKTLLADLKASRKALEKAISLAEYGDKRALAARQLCERNLDDKIRRVAGHVDTESQGDEKLIVSAGFELRKRNNRPKPMAPPRSPAIKRTEVSGEIILRWKPVPNSKNYVVSFMPVGGKNGKKTSYSTRSRCLLKGLVPGKSYTASVKAIGARGIGPASKVLKFIAT